MRRCLTPALIVAAALSSPLTAFARTDCPPGAWFCEDDPGTQAPTQAPAETDSLPPPPVADDLPEEVDDEDALPEPEARPAPPPPVARGRRAQPPVVIYQPAPSSSPPPQIIIVAPGARTRVVRRAPRVVVTRPAPYVVTRPAAPVYAPVAPPAPRYRWRSEWGFNLRLEGISMGGDEDHSRRSGSSASLQPAQNAGMGGFGLSLRYRPVPAFAFDAGFDVIGGTDFNGFERVETPFSLNGIVYVNPRSRLQFYFMGGVNWSSATITSQSPDPRLAPAADGNGYSTEYTYFGGQGGVGLELRLSRKFALNIDALGFIRKRTDDNQAKAEFVDPNTGKTTNTSGGGLFRGGMTFWW